MRWRDYTVACGESASYDEPVDVCAIERRLRISGLLKMAPESVVAPLNGGMHRNDEQNCTIS